MPHIISYKKVEPEHEHSDLTTLLNETAKIYLWDWPFITKIFWILLLLLFLFFLFVYAKRVFLSQRSGELFSDKNKNIKKKNE